MNFRVDTYDTEHLLAFYNDLSAEIRRQLIEGVQWSEVKSRVDLLSELSKELSKRKISVHLQNDNPSAFNDRSERKSSEGNSAPGL
jgi:hypothetical protein